MRNLVLISVILLFSGCSYRYTNFLDFQDKKVLKPVFCGSQSYLFSTNIKLFNKNFSGLLIIKQMPDSIYRAVFTTEIGLTLFDIEIRKDTSIIHSQFEQFNKSAIIKTIDNDLRLLLMNDINYSNTEIYKDKNKHSVYKFHKNKFKNYYYVDNNENYIYQIIKKKNIFDKVIVNLCNYSNNLPQEIYIKHRKFRLKINLKLLQQ